MFRSTLDQNTPLDVLIHGRAACYAVVWEITFQRMAWTTESREKLISALDDALAELNRWVRDLGLSTPEVAGIWDAVIAENGFASRLIIGLASATIPAEFRRFAKVKSYSEAVAYIRSPEFSAIFQGAPEPDAQELTAVIRTLSDALPNLKQALSDRVSVGPRYRHGGRPRELDDPLIRQRICEEITNRRGPGSNLGDIFDSLGQKYGVSAVTIKRIWQKCPK